jgi:sirohydrochlorin cobaltochelatase
MMRKETVLDSVGLLLIGHGSKLPYNKENLEKIAAILRKRSIFGAVAISFMCRDTPTIAEALDMLAQRNVSKIVLVPAFLAAGVHTTQDIPELIEVKEKELQLKAKGIDLLYGQPIGSDERIAKILEEKALNALRKEPKKKQI